MNRSSSDAPAESRRPRLEPEFSKALQGYGLDGVASFSMELGNGDPSTAAGIAQRYPSQSPVLLNTPSLQTNFSPTSIAFWQQVYQDMATVMNAAGLTPTCNSAKSSGGIFRTTARECHSTMRIQPVLSKPSMAVRWP